MHTDSSQTQPTPIPSPAQSQGAGAAELAATAPGGIRVIRRNGKVTNFEPGKINRAMTKAFLAVEGGSAAASSRVRETAAALAVEATTRLIRDHLDDARADQMIERSIRELGEKMH